MAAIGDFNRAIALAPEFVAAYQNRGNAWYVRGNYGEAHDYDTAIKLDPKAASAYVNRATVRRDLGVIDGALADYQKAIELGAGAPAYASRGQLYMRQKDYGAAIADFDRAVRLDADARNLMLRAAAYAADGKFDDAI
ncbi:MAG TPA: tetratricopeptide repeat protein, partial [Pseudolabrys sp.]|nr:tetratricopeptide repeat protein [Pseudolabrys sp.]